MSHDAIVKTVPIWDERALASAIGELQKQGVNCTLQKDSHARVWGTRRIEAPYVIKLPDCRFDVALVRHDDGYLMPVTDLHGGLVKSQIGFPDFYSEASTAEERRVENEMAAVGRFTQQYSNFALINEVEAKGFTIIEQTITAEGELQLSYE